MDDPRSEGMPGGWNVADPRAGDVAEAEQLLARAADDAVELPWLSAAELWVLCGTDQVLADEQETRWWNGLGTQRQQNLAAAVLDFLAHRELIRPADAEPGPGQRPAMPMTPALAMIVAARRYPAVVAVGTREDGSINGTPWMYGLPGAGEPLRAVVVEYLSTKTTELGPVHHFTLLSPERAGHFLAKWVTEAPVRRGGHGLRLLQRGKLRIVDFYRYQDGELHDRDRVTVTGTGSQHMVTRQRPGTGADSGPPVAHDPEALSGLLTGMLREGQP
jgi:hypothetical protein